MDPTHLYYPMRLEDPTSVFVIHLQEWKGQTEVEKTQVEGHNAWDEQKDMQNLGLVYMVDLNGKWEIYGTVVLIEKAPSRSSIGIAYSSRHGK